MFHCCKVLTQLVKKPSDKLLLHLEKWQISWEFDFRRGEQEKKITFD